MTATPAAEPRRNRPAPGRGIAALPMIPTLEFVRQVGLILLAALLYFRVRGLTQGGVGVAVERGLDILAFEERLGIDFEHWAQSMILDSEWLITVANWIYIWGHWPVIAVTLIWLHRTHRPGYLILRNAFFISGAIGLVIFAGYAVAPPRLLDVGLVDTVSEYSTSYRVLQPPSLVNKYAAVPSLHVGWNFLVGVAVHRASRRRLVRLAAVVGPILMACAVVVTANHYIIDGLLGIIVAMAGLLASVWITPRIAGLDVRLRRRWRGPGRTFGRIVTDRYR